MSEIQSSDLEIQSIESVAETSIINFELPREWRVPKNLSLDCQVQKEVSTRRSLNHFYEHMTFISQVEPKTVADALETAIG